MALRGVRCHNPHHTAVAAELHESQASVGGSPLSYAWGFGTVILVKAEHVLQVHTWVINCYGYLYFPSTVKYGPSQLTEVAVFSWGRMVLCCSVNCAKNSYVFGLIWKRWVVGRIIRAGEVKFLSRKVLHVSVFGYVPWQQNESLKREKWVPDGGGN